MAFVTGTATSHNDFFAKLIAFLTTNPDLVDAQQNWSIAWQSPGGQGGGIVLAGPGLAGDDRVLVGINLRGDTGADQAAGQYFLTLYGMTGVIPTTTNMLEHVNISPWPSHIFLDPNPFQYWIIANGRRFIIVLKISTVFQSAYCGLFLPFATPLQYPYPLFIGGSINDRAVNPFNWRNTEEDHRAFCFACTYSLADAYASMMLSPAGEWLSVIGHPESDRPGNVFLHPQYTPDRYFQTSTDGNGLDADLSARYTPHDVYGRMERTDGDGGLYLSQMHLIRHTPNEAIYGVFDGVYKVGGSNNAAENIATIDGVDYLTVQDIFRTELDDYFSVRLS